MNYEQEIIGSVLIDPDLMNHGLLELAPTDFEKPAHSHIWGQILSLWNNDDPVDPVTLTESLRSVGLLERVGGMAYILGVMDTTAVSTNAIAYARSVQDAARLRALSGLGKQLTSRAERGQESSKDLRDFVDGELAKMHSLGNGTGDDEAFEIARSYAKGQARISTGYPSIDQLIGGWPLGDLAILAGRTSMGKSALMHQMAFSQARRGVEVLILSPDQPKPEILANEATRLSDVSLSLLRAGTTPSEKLARWRAELDGLESLVKGPLRIKDGRINIESVELEIRRAARRGVQLVFLDHLQRVSPTPGSRQSRRELMIELTGMLKDLAREYQLTVVALSQLSRGIEGRDDKTPRLDDLSESKSIEEDANVVLMIYRDAYHNPNSLQGNVTEIIVSKSKTSERLKQTQLIFDPHLVSFKEVV